MIQFLCVIEEASVEIEDLLENVAVVKSNFDVIEKVGSGMANTISYIFDTGIVLFLLLILVISHNYLCLNYFTAVS